MKRTKQDDRVKWQTRATFIKAFCVVWFCPYDCHPVVSSDRDNRVQEAQNYRLCIYMGNVVQVLFKVTKTWTIFFFVTCCEDISSAHANIFLTQSKPHSRWPVITLEEYATFNGCQSNCMRIVRNDFLS